MKARLLFIFLFCAAAHAANGEKILRVTFQAAETGFDPVKVHDYYSGTVIEAIFDPLLTYDYLARPAKLVANAAESLPEISADGRTYVFRIRQGIYFADDPAFKGRKRELTALDYAYSFKRFYDPRHRSPYAFLFTGKIVGLDELAAQAKASGNFDYDAPVAGLQTPDRHTLVIRLKQPDLNFSYVLAFPLTGAVAREAIEAYGDESPSHPVGSGPFLLKRYVRSSKIVLAANPGYRGKLWDFAPGDDPRQREIASQMQGKRLPLLDAVEISIMEETQSRWLAFERGETDIEYQLWDVAPTFMTDDGNRRQPDGAPLIIRNASMPTERDRQFDELLKRSLDSIGVRLEIQKERFPELLKLEKQCRLMTRMAAWIADYPDGDNFMQLLYGPNTHESNNACYRSKEFDRRYEKSRRLADGPERDRLYHEMTRRMEVDTVWLLADSRIRNALQQPHVVGFTKHPVLHAEWLYLDLAPRSGD